MGSPTIDRLLRAPYGHDIRRDKAGNSHVTLFDRHGTALHTIVAPTFDEAVTRALDIADERAPTARDDDNTADAAREGRDG